MRRLDGLTERVEQDVCDHRYSQMTASEEQLHARLREHRRMIDGLSRIGPEGLSPEQLMQHVAAQVSRVY